MLQRTQKHESQLSLALRDRKAQADQKQRKLELAQQLFRLQLQLIAEAQGVTQLPISELASAKQKIETLRGQKQALQDKLEGQQQELVTLSAKKARCDASQPLAEMTELQHQNAEAKADLLAQLQRADEDARKTALERRRAQEDIKNAQAALEQARLAEQSAPPAPLPAERAAASDAETQEIACLAQEVETLREELQKSAHLLTQQQILLTQGTARREAELSRAVVASAAALERLIACRRHSRNALEMARDKLGEARAALQFDWGSE